MMILTGIAGLSDGGEDDSRLRGVPRDAGGRERGDGVSVKKEAVAFPVVPTLSESACQLALHSRHLGLSLPSQVWLQIENATIDRSLGEGQPRRHPTLDPESAQILRHYFGRSADAFTTRGDDDRARVSAEAEVNVRQALRVAGVSH